MAEEFKFKEFSVKQDRAAMKIGTDGILLGAWVSLEKEPFAILDIGAGTGVISLQLAQRSNAEIIDALDIDENAYEECVDNFENSPWSDRLFCYHAYLEEFVEEIDDKYDLIISNPPFHAPPASKTNSDLQQNHISEARKLARYNDALPFDELIDGASKLLTDNGTFAVIIPRKDEQYFIKFAAHVNLFPQRICRVRGNPTAEEKRSLIEFSFQKKSPVIDTLTIELSRHTYTEEYKDLVKDFYLKM